MKLIFNVVFLLCNKVNQLNMCVCLVTQSCLTLCMKYGPPGSSVYGFARQEYWSG